MDNIDFNEKETKQREHLMNLDIETKRNIIYRQKDFINRCDFYVQTNPIYYDKGGNWWVWEKKEGFWKQIDETDLINKLREERILRISNPKFERGELVERKNAREDLDVYLQKPKIKEGLSLSGRKYAPKEPKSFVVQFKNGLVDIKTGHLFNPTPLLFITNPIPWSLGESEETPTLDKLFEQWVGKDNVILLYEIIAYCTLASYPIHRIFILNGSGSNGKSSFLNVIGKFIGDNNKCSADLNKLQIENHETSNLYKKTLCLISETDNNTLSRTDMLKKLSGEDDVSFEFKYKNTINAKNTAKLVIATNSLPKTKDNSDGFYRRMLVIDFPNRFQGDIDVLATIPDKEYENLAKKSIRLLKELVERRSFSNEPNNEQKEIEYTKRSDPIKFFIDNYCEQTGSVTFAEFFDHLSIFFKSENLKLPSTKEVGNWLSINNYERIPQFIHRKTKKVIIGLKLKTKE